MSLGLPIHTVAIQTYDSKWEVLFQEEKALIQEALGGWVLDIQHIGSTSVPSLNAKPILDIGIAVENFEEAFRCIPKLEELGYIFRGELWIPRRHFFVKGDPRTHHVHMNEVSSIDWRQTITFRDYLRQNPEAVREYAQIKTRLAAEFPNDIRSYSAGKDEFIQEVLKSVLGESNVVSFDP